MRVGRGHLTRRSGVPCKQPSANRWYYYLEAELRFPFRARCIVERRTSPLKVGEKMQVLGMAPEDDCMHKMFVLGGI
ncbi:MAG: hypothetical protein FJ014_17755 [Chloroflexi bacterium]|nr:hypothetical protein [Chloroflexota bacterium]